MDCLHGRQGTKDEEVSRFQHFLASGNLLTQMLESVSCEGAEESTNCWQFCWRGCRRWGAVAKSSLLFMQWG